MTAPLTLPGVAPSTLRPLDFATDMDARLAWENVNVNEMNALLPAIDAAAGGAVSAAASAAAAAAAATSAYATANAAPWVSLQPYASNANAVSLVNSQTYRAKVSVTSAVDPALDSTRWTALGIAPRTVTPVNATRAIVITDLRTVLLCTGTYALTSASAAALGNGFVARVRNGGTGLITLPATAQAVVLAPGAEADFWSDGTAVYATDYTDGIDRVATATAATTLTLGTMGFVATAMTTRGQSVTLPDATTLGVGGPSAIIDNSRGGFPLGVRDSAGTLLTGIAPGGVAYLALQDKTTAAGVWSITGSSLEPGLVTIDNTFSTTFSTTIAGAPAAMFAALDSNTSVHFLRLASNGFAAFVVDNLGKVVTTPVTITTSSSFPLNAFKINNTQCLLFYGSGASVVSCVVLTLTGASPTYSLAVGTPATTTTAFYDDFLAYPAIAQLSPSLYACVYATSGAVSQSVVAISVSGTTVTVGAALTYAAAASARQGSILPLTPTTAYISYKTGSTGYGAVVSISGTTCSVGTPVATGLGSSAIRPYFTLYVSPTKVIVMDDNNIPSAIVISATISGTSISFGSPVTVLANGTGGATYTGGRAVAPLWVISTGTTNLIGFLNQDTTANAYSALCVLSETAGVIVPGPMLYQSVIDAATANAGAGGPNVVFPNGGNGNDLLALKQEGGAASGLVLGKLRAVPHLLTGTTYTVGTSAQITSSSNAYGTSAANLCLTKINANDYAILPGYSPVEAIAVLRSNGSFVNHRGEIRTPTVRSSSVSNCLPVSNNRLVIMGTTDYVGSNSATSNVVQFRLLNVEIAA